jgi:hypothetical protein
MPKNTGHEKTRKFELSDAVYENYINSIPRINNSVARNSGESFFDALRRNRASFEALRIDGKSVDEIIRAL